MRVGGWAGGATPGSKHFDVTITAGDGSGVPQNVCPARTGRSKVTLTVMGGDIFVGKSAAQAIPGSGETLSPGGAIVLETTADVFALCAAGTTVTAREIYS